VIGSRLAIVSGIKVRNVEIEIKNCGLSRIIKYNSNLAVEGFWNVIDDGLFD